MKVLCGSVLFGAALSTLQVSETQGVPMFVTRIPNGENVPHTTALGHEDGIGESDIRNVFGIAFEEAGMEWTQELCEADSDEDGQTNGQELGDPCCIWEEGDEPLWVKGVSHPGVKTKTSDSSLWANIDCIALQTKASASRNKTPSPDDDDNDDNDDDPDSEDSETEISTGASAASSITSSLVLASVVVSIATLVSW